MSEIPPINSLTGSAHIAAAMGDKMRRQSRRPELERTDRVEKSADREQFEAIVEGLQNEPDVRPNMLELGRNLAKHPPSKEMLDELSSALLNEDAF